jgi:hypothetical protein
MLIVLYTYINIVLLDYCLGPGAKAVISTANNLLRRTVPSSLPGSNSR